MLQQRAYELTTNTSQSGTCTAAEAGRRVLEHSEKVQRGEIPAGLSFGFGALDKCSGGGMKPGNLVIVAGATSVGKSSLATKFALNAAANAASVKIFSNEMSNEEVAQRMQQILSGINGLKISHGRLSVPDWEKVQIAQGTLESWGNRVEITDFPLTVPEMATEVRSMALRIKRPVELIIVDYLQITPAQGRDVREKVNNITRGLKLMAKQLKTPVLLLSQLNRTHQHDNRPPELRDLKESSNIEQDADGAILLYRPEDSVPDVVSGAYTVKAKVAKWRGGMTTTWNGDDAIRLNFAPSITDFREIQ